MSLETRIVGRRVSSLSQDIMVLSDQLPQTADNNRKNLTLPNECCRRTSTDWTSHQTTENGRKKYNTLPLVLPIERALSQPPPLVQINDVWANGEETIVNNMECVDELSITEQTSDSQDSQEDFEVKLIHSGKLDNHHQIVLTTNTYDLTLNDGEEEEERGSSCEGDSENELEVFDNSPLTSQS